jgi:hypothetical protein
MSRATEVDLAVAFIKTTGLRLLLPDLQAATREQGRPQPSVRVLTSDYLDITDPEALRLLLLLQEQGAEVRVFVTAGEQLPPEGLHLRQVCPMASWWKGRPSSGPATSAARRCRTGLEWNYRVVYPGDRGFLEARQRFDEIFVPRQDSCLVGRVDRVLREAARPAAAIAVAPGSHEQEAPPEPTEIQQASACSPPRNPRSRVPARSRRPRHGPWQDLARCVRCRPCKRAPRSVRCPPGRDPCQAAATFVRIRPRARVGYYMGRSRDAEVDVLCASVQTLGRAVNIWSGSPRSTSTMW